MIDIDTDLFPISSLSKDEMKELQRSITSKAIFKDDLNIDDIFDCTIAGVDQAFLDGDKIISSIVFFKDFEIIDKNYVLSDIDLPYIPGLLAFREGPSILKSLRSASLCPDLLLFDGNGRIHFRQAGIATHIGVATDIPSIGVAKNLLCGNPEKPIDKLPTGERIKIKADDTIETQHSTTIGYAFQSKQYKNYKINPIYVSSGHRVSNSSSVDIVEKLCQNYKLPEPIRIADKYADKIKKKLK